MRAAPGFANSVGNAADPRALGTPRAEAPRPILVLGIGNLLMGDEGIGVHAIHRLQQESLPPDVRVVDGGTGGFHLLSYFDEHDTVVMIDATMDGRPPGTLSWIEPRHAADFPRSLTAHDIGLRDLVESSALLGRLPTIHLLTVSVAQLQPMQTSLTPALEAALPRVVDQVVEIVPNAQRMSEAGRPLCAPAACVLSGACPSQGPVRPTAVPAEARTHRPLPLTGYEEVRERRALEGVA